MRRWPDARVVPNRPFPDVVFLPGWRVHGALSEVARVQREADAWKRGVPVGMDPNPLRTGQAVWYGARQRRRSGS